LNKIAIVGNSAIRIIFDKGSLKIIQELKASIAILSKPDRESPVL
jgi:hypothetical protein